MSLFVPLLQALCCCGLGAWVLRLAGLLDTLPEAERWGWSFGLGLGVLGWLTFFLALSGAVVGPVFAAVLLAGALGCAVLPRPMAPKSLDGWEWALAAVLTASFAMDMMEALAPPADADSLAYHFARPKQILAEGGLFPVARAVDGATPMLVQMTYLPALALGGERAMTLWAGFSGWLALLPLFTVARRFLTRPWALALVAVVATAPAWVYGAGSGQVEARLTAFVLLGLMATSMAMKDARWAVVAGLAAGFFAGAKFFGLIFAALCGAALVLRGRWRAALAYGVVAAIAGGQWYVWQWVCLGDPFFPLLWRWLPSPYWDQAHAEAMKALYYQSETSVPANLAWLFAYPVVASVSPLSGWEAGRTGLGPVALVLAPFALVALWRRRSGAASHPLFVVAALAVAFYAAWFLSGTSQRIRHLLPLFPVVALCLTVAARRFGGGRAVAAGLGVVVVLQLAGQAVFTAAYAERLVRGEGRDAFLERTVINFAPVPWINANLGPTDRLLLGERQLIYHLDVPSYFGHEYFQARLNLLPGSQAELDARLTELSRLGITHVLVEPDVDGVISRLTGRMAAAGCLRPLQDFSARVFASRTLGLGTVPTRFQVLEIVPACRKEVEGVQRLG